MARRSLFTEVCCIACDELEQLGAGAREGWLTDPSLLAALHTSALALAHTSFSLFLLLPLDPSSFGRPIIIRPSLSAEEGRISAIEWLPFADLLTLAVGTSTGSLLLYSTSGDLIHRQVVHPGRILRLRFREKRGQLPQDATLVSAASEELSVSLPGAIARFDGSDIQNLLRRWLHEGGSRTSHEGLQSEDEDNSPFGRLSFQLWSVNKFGACVDSAIVGLMPPPLLELQLLLLLDSPVIDITVLLPLEKMLLFQHIGFLKIEVVL